MNPGLKTRIKKKIPKKPVLQESLQQVWKFEKPKQSFLRRFRVPIGLGLLAIILGVVAYKKGKNTNLFKSFLGKWR